MTTTVKSRPKIDFEQWAKPKDPEPKTLEECLAEAGGFPFAARAVAPATIDFAWPMGTELHCLGWGVENHMRIDPQIFRGNLCDGVKLNNKHRRWILLGHKT